MLNSQATSFFLLLFFPYYQWGNSSTCKTSSAPLCSRGRERDHTQSSDSHCSSLEEASCARKCSNQHEQMRASKVKGEFPRHCHLSSFPQVPGEKSCPRFFQCGWLFLSCSPALFTIYLCILNAYLEEEGSAGPGDYRLSAVDICTQANEP